MPASSETRSRWRKRKRESRLNRKSKPQPQDEDEIEDDVEFEDEDNNNDDEDQIHPNPSHSNRTAPAAPIESEVLSDGGIRVSQFPPVVRRTVNRPHSSVLFISATERACQLGESGRHNSLVLENISYGQLQALSAVTPDSLGDLDRADGSSGAFVITPPGIMEGRGVGKRLWTSRVLVVPMHADWFSPYTVNRLERQVVPHYFSGKSVDHTPERYMECRNCIVAKYMENPEKRLPVSECDNLVVGVDIDDMTRIFRFLDHWGIINYCAASVNRESGNDGSCFSEDSNGELRVPMTHLKSIDSLIQFDKPKCRLRAADVYPELACPGYEDSDLDSRIRERLSENQCNYCSRPLPIVYYQSQKEVDVLLCLDCFHEGRFITGHSSLDFTRVVSGKDYGDLEGENWSDQETLLLLEAMEIYSENWNEIAEHVGTKSKAQCILHFLRMPMDDSSLENVEVPRTPISLNMSNNDEGEESKSNSNGNPDGSGSSILDPDFKSRLPFANYANPVMALVAFLASAVGPRVAAACAHASLAALSEDEHVDASGNIRQMDRSGCGNPMKSESMLGKEGSTHGDITNSSQQKGVQGQWTHRDAAAAPLSDEKVRAASKAGLSAAATKAKLFADHEEREIQRLSANIINHQLKRLELKLKQFAEVETMLMKECEQVERVKQRIAAERAVMISTQFGPAGVTRPTGLPGVGPALVHNNAGNNRQQVVSGVSSQPFISGYGNNQSIHPHVSPVPQQPTYGLGPRLPLSAINPSSASPNITTPHAMLRPLSGTRSVLD